MECGKYSNEEAKEIVKNVAEVFLLSSFSTSEIAESMNRLNKEKEKNNE